MLTDIFAERYKQTPLWATCTSTDQRLLVQMFRIFSEQVCPFHGEANKTVWSDVQSRLSMELGQVSLSPLIFEINGTKIGKPFEVDDVCKKWFLTTFDGSVPADRFIKERVSFIELGFRLIDDRIARVNAHLPDAIETFREITAALSGKFGDPNSVEQMEADNEKMNQAFRESVDELNARFQQADCSLNYHNGIIQLATDERTETEIEAPFWKLVSDTKWKNVDTDMKEAFDRRDNSDRDPAFYAVRALESAIKIVSDAKQWTHGKERGAHNYIDNLSSNEFVSDWEATALKHLFTSVRNPLGHGPGSAEMPTLTTGQTDWAIDASLSWIKRLVRST